MNTNEIVAATLKRLEGSAAEALATHKSAIEGLQDRLEAFEARADRPKGTQGVSPAQSEYCKEFSAWMRKPHDKHHEQRLTEAAHDLSKKDVTIGTPSQGGYALPLEISRDIARRAVDLNPLRQYVRVDTCGSNDYRVLLDMSDSGSGWSSETGTRNDTGTPTLRDRSPSFGEQYAIMVATEWALDDVFFDVQSWLVNGTARQFAAGELDAVVNGNASNRPRGFLNATPVATADDASPERDANTLQYIGLSGSPPSFNYDSIVDLVHSLKSEYLLDPSCAFFAHRTSIAALRKIKDEYGSPIWQESAQAGQPGRLLGYPVVTVDSMPTFAPSADAIAFGAWQQAYVLADRVGMRVLADPYSTPGKVRFYLRRRIGGTVLNNDAAKILRIA
jgi:HK97 family phage major capsid protein